MRGGPGSFVRSGIGVGALLVACGSSGGSGSDADSATTTGQGSGSQSSAASTSGTAGTAGRAGGDSAGNTAEGSSAGGSTGSGAGSGESTGGTSSSGGSAGGDGSDPAASAGGASGAASGGIGDAAAARCEDPTPILQAGSDLPSGFVRCADGVVHRESVETCVDPVGTSDQCPADCLDSCTDGANASCRTRHIPGVCTCHYGCGTDADCGDGEICACAGVFANQPRCVAADCTETAECAGTLCGLSVSAPCGPAETARTRCLSADNECRTNEECAHTMHMCGYGQQVPGECRGGYCVQPNGCQLCG
jgi:hypothetical protein